MVEVHVALWMKDVSYREGIILIFKKKRFKNSFRCINTKDKGATFYYIYKRNRIIFEGIF